MTPSAGPGDRPAVWITRPEPAGRRTAQAVEDAGGTVVALAVLEVEIHPPRPVPRAWPDWILLVSRNAGLGLEGALGTPGMPRGDRDRVRVGAVGRATAAWARERGWNVEVVASPENAQGLTAALGERDLAGNRVWIPAGNREGTAVRVLSPALAAAGAEVERFGVYDVHAISASPERWEPLAARTPGAIVFHSPSAVEAVAEETAVPVVRWRESAVWVAIGETTATRCDRLGGRKVIRSAEPSDPGVVAALASIGTLGVREGRP